MRKTLILAAAAATFGGVGATSWAQKPDKNATLTITAAPLKVKFGKATTISGTLSTKQAAINLILEGDAFPYDGKFDELTKAITTADGNYTFSIAPALGTKYRVTTEAKPAVTSPEVNVLVTWAVSMRVSDSTPNKGARVRFSGAVKPAYPNGKVLIQRRTAAGFKTVKETIMTAGDATQSTYSVRVRVRNTGKYRAVVQAANGLEDGISRVRRLVVG